MTAKRCFKVHLYSQFNIANLLISLFFALAIVCLHAFSAKIKLPSTPLITFPGVHVAILVIFCFLVLARPLKKIRISTYLLSFWLFFLYINCAYWAFLSNDYKAVN